MNRNGGGVDWVVRYRKGFGGGEQMREGKLWLGHKKMKRIVGPKVKSHYLDEGHRNRN